MITISITTVHIQIHIHIQYKYTGGLCCSGMNAFINSWLRFMVTRGERHNSYYADPHSQHAAYLMVFKISVSRDLQNLTTCLKCRRPKKPNCHHNSRKLNCLPPWSNLNWLFSKSSNSQDHLFQAWCHPHSSPISCLGVYYDNGDCHILCAWA